MEAQRPVSEPVPPYVSFGTLLNQLDRMAENGVPSRIDASFLVGMAGGTQNQFKQALRALGLIGDNDAPTDLLIRLVRQPDERPALMGELLRDRFPRLTELDPSATRGELDEALASYGLGAETRRKAASFYISAATYADLPLSTYLRPSRTGNAGSTSRRRSRTTRKPVTDSATIMEKPRAVDDATAMRSADFQLLLDKAKDAGDLDTDLLDRIERLIEGPRNAEEAR